MHCDDGSKVTTPLSQCAGSGSSGLYRLRSFLPCSVNTLGELAEKFGRAPLNSVRGSGREPLSCSAIAVRRFFLKLFQAIGDLEPVGFRANPDMSD